MLNLAKSFVQKVTVTRLATTTTRTLYVTPKSLKAVTTTAEKTSNADEPINIPNPFQKEKQQCVLCRNNIEPTYKNVKLLSQFQSPFTGRIYGRHITGLCKHKQEQVEKAIIYAQNCAMMPYYHKDVDFLKDPRLFDPERPVRPHKY